VNIRSQERPKRNGVKKGYAMQQNAPFSQHPDEHAPHTDHPPIGEPDHGLDSVVQFYRKHGEDLRHDACPGYD